jgi:manganese oxidase
MLTHVKLTIATVLAVCSLTAGSQARIEGANGTVFSLTAKPGYISAADGNTIHCWGYADGDGPMQYPGLTMIVNQGDSITVNLSNELPVPVSILFPGQSNISYSGGSAGLLAREAAPGGSVTYYFTAANPGTFTYYSGTMPEVQIQMGLVGAIIVRPTGYDHMDPQAYEHPDTKYDHEYLFLLTDIDSRIHDTVEQYGVSALEDTDYLSHYFPNYWFINGRNAPDTMAEAFVPWFPSQPYNCMPMMHPGEKLLMRVIGGGRQLHPFHFHGNNAWVIAHDGKLLESTLGAGPDLALSSFTIQSVPGQTDDAIFTWNGKDLGWDIYAHSPGDPLEPGEYAPDHGKPFPVILPEPLDVTVGDFYGGTPFLGIKGEMQPGKGTGNQEGQYVYMWHSHTEKELTNFDIFPGGMMAMLMIVPPSVPIEH